jgi:hypothetical protein
MSFDLSPVHGQVGMPAVRLAKAALALVAGLLLAAGAVHAQEKKAEGNAVERTAKKAADATGRTVERAAKATERTAKRAVGAVERGAKAADKALTNAGEKTENWVKQKTQ